MKWLGITVIMVCLFFFGRYMYFKPSIDDGNTFPEMEININGPEKGRADLNGNIVLVDFWGSWCGPCRKENPELVKLYSEYHDKPYDKASNFEILSIGIETNEARWLRAIERDNLGWPWHYTSLKNFEEPLAKELRIRQIPTKLLLNEKGRVISVKPSFEEIRSYLNKRLKS